MVERHAVILVFGQILSRKWVIFQDSFKDYPKIYLEEWTSSDIKPFVQDKLGRNELFKKLVGQELQYSELIKEIVNKASGVFVWIELVVRSLIEGSNNGDRISDFRRKVQGLPSDLHEFMMQILRNLEKDYLSQAAVMFKVALHNTPLFLMTLSFIDEEDPNFPLDVDDRGISEDEIQERIDTAQRRLNSRCKGLLESFPVRRRARVRHPNSFFIHTVDFMHRTAQEFLKTEDAQKILQPHLRNAPNPNVCLLRAFIAEIKSFPVSTSSGQVSLSELFVLVENSLYYASEAEISTGLPQTVLLDEMDRIMSLHQQRLFVDTKGSWTNRYIGVTGKHNSFFIFAIDSVVDGPD
ncbi:MAG: hypothetical protein M1834_002474 [Cirrosporium novae-zelandiae]|nr:MAG: hypothetical protein M1834_002474 [Cirrosporium novae-zelandiae]